MGRPHRSSAAIVLASISQTGTELVRQVGIANASHPNNDRVPRAVLVAVLQQCSALHSTLFEHIAAIEQGLEAEARAGEQDRS